MSIQGPVTMTAEAAEESNDRAAACQPQPRAATQCILMLKARLADLWPATMIGVAVSLTLAWTGLLMGLLWWGIAWLIGPAVS